MDADPPDERFSMRRVHGLLVVVLLLLSGVDPAGCLTRPEQGDAASTARVSSRAVKKLLVFVVENHSSAQMRNGMPKTFALARRFGYASDYHAIRHPSLPNYIAIASGDTHGVDNDAPPSSWRLRGHTIFSRAI